MPRPITKQDLLTASHDRYVKMWELIDSMTQNELNTQFNFGSELLKKEAHWKRDKNLRDILVHLYEWHELLLRWVESNQNGEQASFLPEPYNWRTYGDMNVAFWKKHQNTNYDKSKQMLQESHDAVMKLIEHFSNDELFTKGHFLWTGGSTLGQYCVSTTSSHYDWAIKKIKAHIKSLK